MLFRAIAILSFSSVALATLPGFGWAFGPFKFGNPKGPQGPGAPQTPVVTCNNPNTSIGSGNGNVNVGVSGCTCPEDLNGDDGVLINVFPGYQCAYPGGACSWSDNTGKLQNTQQTNCPNDVPCSASGCVCPIDKNLNNGVLINRFKGFQCAYTAGACTWDNDGNLSNTAQTNCPKVASKCKTN